MFLHEGIGRLWTKVAKRYLEEIRSSKFNTILGNRQLFYLCIILFFISTVYLFSKYQITDEAFFGGDTWQYHSIGVNLSLGHGVKFGGIEDFNVYKFSKESPSPGHSEGCFERFNGKSRYSFYRAPGYPFFLAFIYKLFGVHPGYAKIIQLILLALSASILPVIGLYYWSKPGIISGMLSSFLFLKYFCPEPNIIMGEPLLTFGLILWTIMFVFWEHAPTKRKTFSLGISSILLLFIKGSTIFLPIFFIIYLVWKFRKTWKKTFVYTILFIAGFSLFSIPWSIYASQKSGKFIFVSTQGSNVLLDGNNEDCFSHGGWNPSHRKWKRNDMTYLYNRLRSRNLSSSRKVFIFMCHYKNMIPRMVKNKLIAGFRKLSIFFSVLGMLFYYLIWVAVLLGKKYNLFFLPPLSPPGRFPLFPILFFTNILFITLILFGDFRFILPFGFAFLLPATYIPLYLAKQVFELMNKTE